MKGFEVECAIWKGGGDAAEAMAGSQLLEKCEGLPSSSEGSSDTREGTVVGSFKQCLAAQEWSAGAKAGGGGFRLGRG